MNQELVLKTQKWIANYKVPKTSKAATTAHNRLMQYLGDNDLTVEEWINGMSKDEDARYHQLQDYISYLPLMPSTIKQYYAFTKAYLRIVHRIKIDRDEQKDLIKFPRIAKIEREPLSKDTIKELCKASSDYYKTLFLVLSSSGMRLSECLALTKDKIDFKTEPVTVTLEAATTKTQTKRITFISNEAAAQLEKIKSDFFETHDINAVEQYFWKLRIKLALIEKYDNTPNYKINIHSFRSFFRTQAGKVNRDFAESVLGHEGYLKQYIRLSLDEKMTYYKKTEPKLRIY